MKEMDDYSKGVFECLSWLEALIQELESRDRKENNMKILREEVSSTILEIQRGVGGDFRNRLRARF